MKSAKNVLPEIKAKLYPNDVRHAEIISARLAALGLDSSNSGVIRYALEQTAQNAGANELMNMLKNALGVEDEKSLQTQTIAAVMKLLTVSEKSEKFLTDFGHVRTTLNANFIQNEKIKGKLDASNSIHGQLKDSVDMLLRTLDNLNLDKKAERVRLGEIEQNVDRVLEECEGIKRSNIASIQKDYDYDLARRAASVPWSQVIAAKKEQIIKAAFRGFGFRHEERLKLSNVLEDFPPLCLADIWDAEGQEARVKVGFTFEHQLWDVLICQIVQCPAVSPRLGYIVLPISSRPWDDLGFIGIRKHSSLVKYRCALLTDKEGVIDTAYATEEIVHPITKRQR